MEIKKNQLILTRTIQVGQLPMNRFKRLHIETFESSIKYLKEYALNMLL